MLIRRGLVVAAAFCAAMLGVFQTGMASADTPPTRLRPGRRDGPATSDSPLRPSMSRASTRRWDRTRTPCRRFRRSVFPARPRSGRAASTASGSPRVHAVDCATVVTVWTHGEGIAVPR